MHSKIYRRIFLDGELDNVSYFWWCHGLRTFWINSKRHALYMKEGIKRTYKEFVFAGEILKFLRTKEHHSEIRSYFRKKLEEARIYYYTSESYRVIVMVKYAGIMFVAFSTYPVAYTLVYLLKAIFSGILLVSFPIEFLFKTCKIIWYPVIPLYWGISGTYSLITSTLAVTGTFITELALMAGDAVNALYKKFVYRKYAFGSKQKEIFGSYTEIDLLVQCIKHEFGAPLKQKVTKFTANFLFEKMEINITTNKGLMELEWYSNEDIKERIRNLPRPHQVNNQEIPQYHLVE